jgi:hypothetical protein
LLPSWASVKRSSMAEEQKPVEPKRANVGQLIECWCKKLIANPIIGSFALVFGILGTGFGFYTYKIGVRERELSFYVSPARTPIVQKGKLENFSVSFAGRAITGDLSSVEIQLWNAGKESIRKENILRPITIQTANNFPIYQVTCEIGRDVINPKITPTDGTSGIITLDWNIMEKGDGVKIHFIFGGDVKTPIVVGGVIEGQERLNQILPPIAKRDTWKAGLVQTLILGAFISVCFLLFRLFGAVISSNNLKSLKRRTTRVVLALVLVGLLFSSCYGAFRLMAKCMQYTVAPVTPPYGF